MKRGRGVPWRNERVGGPSAWRNNHVLSRWDVIGCDSFASWILMIANTQQTFILFYFMLILFQRLRTDEIN